MSRPKESLPFRGSSLLGHAVETMLLCAHPVVVVARDRRQELPPLTIESELVLDDMPGEGPLAAMVTGLRALQGRCEAVMVVSCDAPFVDAEVVDWMARRLGSRDAVVPAPEGQLWPLTALYRTRVLPRAEELLAAGERAPRALVGRIDAVLLDAPTIDAFDPERRFLRDLDTPEDYGRWRE